MKKIVFGIFVFLMAITVIAKENNTKSDTSSDNEAISVLTGTVTDSESGELLVGVEIKIDGTDLKTYTDLDGNFTFKVKPGNYKLVSSYISYREKEEILTINSKENDVKIKLQTSN